MMRVRNNRPKGDLKNLVNVYSYLWPHKGLVAIACFSLIVNSISVLAIGWALKFLVDDGLTKGNAALLDNAYYMLMGLTLVIALGAYGRSYFVALVGERMVSNMRKDVYSHITGMHIGYFEMTRTGELLSRLTTDTAVVLNIVGGSISLAARNSLLFVGGVTMLIITSPQLTLYVSILGPLVIVPIIWLGRKVRELARETQARIADVNAHAEESLNGIRAIQALTLETENTRIYVERVNIALRTALGRVRTRALLNAIVIMLVFGAVVTVIWIGGKDALEGRITTGELASFVFYSVLVAGAIGAITELISELQKAAGAAERVFELLAMKSEITSPESPVAIPDKSQAEVTFDKVRFSYPTRKDKAAIESFDFTVNSGQTVALVGPSGAGKSTMFQLLMRFYDPDQGSIHFNGVDIRKAALPQLRGMIGLVPQDPVIFSTSARENIRIGSSDATDEEIIEAARAACALEFIEKLPQGFDTYLGEKGVRLSGGQRQRIAIARALIRDPQLLLLDEATSALDSESEYFIQQALEKLMKGRTTFVIAHRLSTIRKADVIILLNYGVIEATGTHQELLESNTLYARLAELQFKTDT